MTAAQTVGVLGAGQLGRMLALGGYPLGLRFAFYDTVADAPASQLGPLTIGDFDDDSALRKWAHGVDVVTYEFENVPVTAARAIEHVRPVYPPPLALEQSQDRLAEKTLFRRLGIPTPAFEIVNTLDDLRRAAQRLDGSLVLKTRRMGYDGKGQAVVRSPTDLDRAWQQLGRACDTGGSGLIAEELVPFDRELSVLAVRGLSPAATRFYPLVQNEHREGMLRQSLAPAPGVSAALQRAAEDHAAAVLDALDYRGVLTIEWFEVGGRILANEMAPRVHNSGHWTIEGATCSQFENHVRAVAGLPLGSTAMRWPGAVAAMVNLIGRPPPAADLLAMPAVHFHDYGKQPRAGRKVGHATVVAPANQDVQQLATTLRRFADHAAALAPRG